MYTARPASGEQVDTETIVNSMVSGTPAAVPFRPAKLDRMSLRTTPPSDRTLGPFEPSAGNGPCVSSGIRALQDPPAVLLPPDSLGLVGLEAHPIS